MAVQFSRHTLSLAEKIRQAQPHLTQRQCRRRALYLLEEGRAINEALQAAQQMRSQDEQQSE